MFRGGISTMVCLSKISQPESSNEWRLAMERKRGASKQEIDNVLTVLRAGRPNTTVQSQQHGALSLEAVDPSQHP